MGKCFRFNLRPIHFSMNNIASPHTTTWFKHDYLHHRAYHSIHKTVGLSTHNNSGLTFKRILATYSIISHLETTI